MKLTDKDIIEEKDSNEAQRKIQFKRKIVMKLTEEDIIEEEDRNKAHRGRFN